MTVLQCPNLFIPLCNKVNFAQYCNCIQKTITREPSFPNNLEQGLGINSIEREKDTWKEGTSHLIQLPFYEN
jgi:hypothetical protein